MSGMNQGREEILERWVTMLRECVRTSLPSIFIFVVVF